MEKLPIIKPINEAVTNSCVHADFYSRQGLVIQKSDEGYRLSNPGSVRISIPEAVSGGISDPRNGIMLKIFSLIDFGERAGSGLSGIYKVWERVFHTPAIIEETHKNGVDRTILTLPTAGNQQDVNAMIELYGDMGEPQYSRTEPQTTLTFDPFDPQNEPQYVHEPVCEFKKEPQKEPQNKFLKLLNAIHVNPKITKAELSEELGISISTLKRWLRINNVVWIGSSKRGYWEVL